MRLPEGQLALVIADTEASTAALREMGSAQFAASLATQRRIFDEAAVAFDGVAVPSEGDAALLVFSDPTNALSACAQVQRAIAATDWPEAWQWRIRMGMQLGEAIPVDDDFVGIGIHKAARVAAAANGGQVILSREAVSAAGPLADGLQLRSLGCYRLRDHDEVVELFSLDDAARDVDDRPLRALPAEGHGLPLLRTTLVGRRAELGEITKLVTDNRLATIVGPGGAGKSRLAVEAATELLPDVPDGAWWIDLAPLRDDGAVPGAVVAGLALAPDNERPASEQALDALVGRKLLLVFDNCEHRIDAVGTIVDRILSTASGVKVLCTSRLPLRLPDEAIYRLPPLGFSEPGPKVDLDQIVTSDAVRLLVERVAQKGTELQLDERTAPLASRLCARLDGLPLAIELAAPRVANTGLASALARVEAGLDPGGFGSRSSSDRHRSLTTMLEWSWELLGPTERTVFRRLAVLPAGATPETAAAVVGDDLDGFAVLDALETLAEQSLLVGIEGADGHLRYRHLETMRTFALEQLETAGERASAVARSARWLSQRLAEILGGNEWWAAIRAATPDLANFRAAWTWAREGDAAVFRRLADSGGALLHELGLLDEARSMVNEALAMTDTEPPPTRARLLRRAAILAQAAVDEAAAVAMYEELLATDHALPWERAEAWLGLCEMALWHFDGERAVQLGTKALDVADEANLVEQAAAVCTSLVRAAGIAGDLEAASMFVDKAAAYAASGGGPAARRSALVATGRLAEMTGDIGRLRDVNLEIAAQARALGNVAGLFHPMLVLGDVALTRGDLRSAKAHFEEMLGAARLLGRPESFLIAHGMLEEIAVATGDLDAAAEHAARVDALAKDIGGATTAIAATAGFISLAIGRSDLSALPALADDLRALAADGLEPPWELIAHGLAGVALAPTDQLELARHELSLAIDRATPDLARELATYLILRADVGASLGEPRSVTAAAADAARALSIVIDLRAELIGAEALTVTARLLASDQPGEAARMLAVADTLRARQGTVLPRHDAERREVLIRRLGGTLPAVPTDVTIEAAASEAIALLEGS